MSRARPVPIGPIQERYLRSLHRYHYLTAPQLCRLHHSAGSLTYVQEQLKKLFEQDYLGRFRLERVLPDGTPAIRGTAPLVYFLKRRGFNRLLELGVDTPARFRPASERTPGDRHLRHTLAVNDFLISAALLGQYHPDLKLVQLKHELELPYIPVKVPISYKGQKERIAVRPDGWLDFSISYPEGPMQVAVSLEIDRGTTEQRAFRETIRARICWAQGDYQKAFGTDSLTIAYVVSGPANRLQEVKDWIEAELEQLDKRELASVFLMTDLDPATSSPSKLFTEPVWLQPFSSRPVPLIEGVNVPTLFGQDRR